MVDGFAIVELVIVLNGTHETRRTSKTLTKQQQSMTVDQGPTCSTCRPTSVKGAIYL